MPSNATFMSYNSTGIKTVECIWTQDISDNYDMNYLGFKNILKPAKTLTCFKVNFKNLSSYVIPRNRPPGQDSGRAKVGSKYALVVQYNSFQVRRYTSAKKKNFKSEAQL